MKKTSLSAAFLLCACLPVLQAANPFFNPRWRLSDHFKIEFSFTQTQDLKQPEPAPPISTTVTYTYTVTGTPIENGRHLATILAVPDRTGWSLWRLTLDADEVVLLSVEEVGTPIRYNNPFAEDAWMANLNQYKRIILLDFPKIPDKKENESRTIGGGASSTPGFTQTISFGSSDVTALMTRTDPETSLLQQTRIVWKSGEPWWSTASMHLGPDTEISGKLLLP